MNQKNYRDKGKQLKNFPNLVEYFLNPKTIFFDEKERVINWIVWNFDLYFWENGFFNIFNDHQSFQKVAQNQKLESLYSWYDENFSKSPHLIKDLFSFISLRSLKMIFDNIKKQNFFSLDFSWQNDFNSSFQSLKKQKNNQIKKDSIKINKYDIPCDQVKEFQTIFLSKLNQKIKNNQLDSNYHYKILCSKSIIDIFNLHFEHKTEKNDCQNSFWLRYDNGTLTKEKKALSSLFQFLFDDLKIIIDSKKDRKLKKLDLVEKIIDYLNFKKIECFGKYYQVWKLFVDDLYKKKTQKQILFNLLKSYYRIYYKNQQFSKWEFINCCFFDLDNLYASTDHFFKDNYFDHLDMIFVPFENQKNVAFNFNICTQTIKFWNFKALNQKNNIFLRFAIKNGIFYQKNEQKLKYLFAFKQK